MLYGSEYKYMKNNTAIPAPLFVVLFATASMALDIATVQPM